ncbi:MAG TPA: ribonuclease HII [Patescibacteria group bacterium]|uniref:Ribonuclease n=1 Tax=Candidatus Woesebacteria bacterium RIFCSPHIGHO2_01_FULL_41_10 TaxID=1802500 RepID=A0A1F7YNR9_9BACT|nr:MAG: hypothetical protein A2801_01150 [Candidatus Woesebacteria bacterium RIFCSPHIGHO2_01_FULL_41_10]HLD01446.1 ribonuclease HII [Patescibacteria group bacterium]
MAGNIAVVGIDEVGRGAFAGPLVAAAVVLGSAEIALSSGQRGQKAANSSSYQECPVIRDSKKMTQRQRMLADRWIRANCIFSVGMATVEEINCFGIVEANQLAFTRSLEIFSPKSCYLYSDAYAVVSWPKDSQQAIVHGEDAHPCIAAASIIAKEYRDTYMRVIAPIFPKFGWEKNVGYGTKIHRGALKIYGPTIHHRSLFIKNWV